MLGYILGGELAGTGIGFVISGEIAALVGWRWAFWWLIIPSAALVWLVWRLPEPARDGQSRLQPGETRIPDEDEVAGSGESTGTTTDKPSDNLDSAAHHAVRRPGSGLSQHVFGGSHGLEYTFLIFLLPVIAAGLLGLAALRTYPRDVATTAESYRRAQPSEPAQTAG
jgi:MFS family permease